MGIISDTRVRRRDKKPEEPERRDEPGLRTGEIEVGLHKVGGGSDEIHEAHREEAEHHGDKLHQHALGGINIFYGCCHIC